ncbi:MAG: hypothetical protein U0572_02795 [Phycisphaerales bacterium]
MNVRGRQIEGSDENCLAILLPRFGATNKVGAETATGGDAAWIAIVLRAQGESFSVIAEREVRGHDLHGNGFANWLAPHRPKRAIAVLPASATVCRTCSLPPAQGEQLISALRLQAETALLGSVPSHRIGMAMVPDTSARANAARQGLIVAWPETATIIDVPELPPTCELRYVPILACLVALLDGEMPSSPLIRASREDGSVIFLLGTPNGLLMRSTREDGSDAKVWRDGVQRAAAETLLASNRSADEIRTLQAELEPQFSGAHQGAVSFFPSSVTRIVSTRLAGGRTGEPAKDLDRTIALGAALVATGPLAGLATIRRSLPTPPLHPLERADRWLAVPRNTLAVVFAAMLVFMFGPLAFSAMRYGVLRLKVRDPAKIESLNRDTQQSVAVYRQLQKEAWPMTKLLGDLSNSLPEGIDVEMIQIAHGDGVLLKGVAKPFDQKEADGKSTRLSAAEELTRMESMLRSTKIFTNAQYKWDPDDAKGYRTFTLTCNVTQPTRNVAWGSNEDYAKVPYRDRKYPNWREIEKGNHPTPGAGDRASNSSASEDEPSRPATKPAEVAHASPDPKALADASKSDAPKVTVPPKGDGATGDGAKVDGEGDEAPAQETTPLPNRGIGRAKPTPPPGDAPGEKPTTAEPSKPGQPATPTIEVPGPFSDEEIKALSKSEAQALLGKISRARQLPTLDEETKKRLKEDFQRVLAQAKAASS